ncbi:hypothetical protein [Methylobacter sp. BBA5.1]|nr:hypothetical protein [Methylobacter sp. BBA5.1]
MKTIFTPIKAPPPKKINWNYDAYFVEQLKRINATREKKTPRGGVNL